MEEWLLKQYNKSHEELMEMMKEDKSEEAERNRRIYMKNHEEANRKREKVELGELIMPRITRGIK